MSLFDLIGVLGGKKKNEPAKATRPSKQVEEYKKEITKGLSSMIVVAYFNRTSWPDEDDKTRKLLSPFIQSFGTDLASRATKVMDLTSGEYVAEVKDYLDWLLTLPPYGAFAKNGGMVMGMKLNGPRNINGVLAPYISDIMLTLTSVVLAPRSASKSSELELKVMAKRYSKNKNIVRYLDYIKSNIKNSKTGTAIYFGPAIDPFFETHYLNYFATIKALLTFSPNSTEVANNYRSMIENTKKMGIVIEPGKVDALTNRILKWASIGLLG